MHKGLDADLLVAKYTPQGSGTSLSLLPDLGEFLSAVPAAYAAVEPWSVENGSREGRFLRIQVKSTEMWMGGSYLCQLHGCGERLYTAKEIDYFGVYVLPDDVWYIFLAIQRWR